MVPTVFSLRRTDANQVVLPGHQIPAQRACTAPMAREHRLEMVTHEIWPFLIALIGGLMLIILAGDIVLVLPRLLGLRG